MKKAELLLAKKTILAHQVKLESQQIKDELHQRRPNTGALSSGALGNLRTFNTSLNSSISSPTLQYNKDSGDRVERMSTSGKSSSMQDLHHFNKANNNYVNNYSTQNTNNHNNPTTMRPATSTSSSTYSKQSTTGNNVLLSSPHMASSRSKGNDGESKLAQELAQRSVTNKTNLRKTQAAVSKSVEEELFANKSAYGPASSSSSSSSRFNSSNNHINTQYSSRPGTSSSAAHNPFSASSKVTQSLTSIPEYHNNDEFDQANLEEENFFMPKKKIFRADGASLYDIYLSKKGDTWGSILKAQIKDDEENKLKQKLAKQAANERYGALLRTQVQDYETRKHQEYLSNESFASLEHDKTQKMADMQNKRIQDARNRHEQFVRNAMEDIALKENLKQAELKADLRASTIMVNNAKKYLAEEEEKKAQERLRMKTYQDKIYQENLDNIRRRQENKQNSHSEDRRIIEEQERIFRREQQRRDQERNERVKRSTEGPAHHIVEKIVELRRSKEDELHSSLFTAENSLNKQLYASENAAKARAAANGANLELEWQQNTLLKQQARQAHEAHLQAIQELAVQQLKEEEMQEIQKREAQRQKQRDYQAQLDAQLQAQRQRSFDSLKKTMSQAEIKFNADLIRKTGLLPQNLL